MFPRFFFFLVLLSVSLCSRASGQQNSASLPAAQAGAATLPTPQPEQHESEENKPTQQSSHTSRLASLRSVITPGNAMARTELVDLNSASKEMLMTLPGITEADAISIIDARPYKSTLQFKIKNIIAPEKYTQIADRVMARQSSRKGQSFSPPVQP